MPDRLYLLKPGFEDEGQGPFFCAECALVEGMLSFVPGLRDRIDVTYVNYERPRPQIVSELGDEHQSSPVLVLDDPKAVLPDGIHSKESNGKRFIDEPNEICEYLAKVHAVARPHAV